MSSEREEPETSNIEEEEDSDEEDDEDYVPGKEGDCPDDDGDVSGGDDDDGGDSDTEEGGCDSSSKKRKKVHPDVSNKEMKSESDQKLLTAAEEKAKADKLWAELNSLDEPSSTTSNSNQVKPATVKLEPSSTVTSSSLESEPLVSESNQATNVSMATSSSSTTTVPTVPAIRKSGGLSNLAASLGKKKGPSTLVQSKADWDSFKSETGLVEELAEHTKGKQSFVERQAFLSRSDVREFEREKDIRDKIRSARRLP